MQQNRRNLPRYLVNKPGLQWSAQRRRASAWGIPKHSSKHYPRSHGARANIGRARAGQGWAEQAHLDANAGTAAYFATGAVHNASERAESTAQPEVLVVRTSTTALLPMAADLSPLSCPHRCSPAAEAVKRGVTLKKIRYQDEHL